MTKNTLTTIGWIGIKTAYLNVEPEEALKRYLAANPETREEDARQRMDVYEFEDEFSVYDAWAEVQLK